MSATVTGTLAYLGVCYILYPCWPCPRLTPLLIETRLPLGGIDVHVPVANRAWLVRNESGFFEVPWYPQSHVMYAGPGSPNPVPPAQPDVFMDFVTPAGESRSLEDTKKWPLFKYRLHHSPRANLLTNSLARHLVDHPLHQSLGQPPAHRPHSLLYRLEHRIPLSPMNKRGKPSRLG